ncbi:hypothetical protein K469DRAFT_758158 [Zopfia rhizophila CBS 207.26]|uniref:Uncharacterized protein n=1 Tax=Zopfia rhizophila CBS 207.26 TaxID=1314779 RepID=A0A6A6EVL3_9PEZI|nr:hypothetical protein K469DRAFT_758158 [Zopfia rhizophila CBS 207.26]
MDFSEEDERCHRRLAAVTENIQLLQRSAEDAKRDARQWAAQSGKADPTVDTADLLTSDGEEDKCSWRLYRPGEIGSTTRLINVLRSAIGTNQITAGSNDVRLIIQQLCDFLQAASYSSEDILTIMDYNQENRTIRTLDRTLADGHVPEQVKVKSIKSQQAAASRERERMIQGLQEQAYSNAESHNAAVYRVMNGFRKDDLSIIPLIPEASIWTNSTAYGRDISSVFDYL